MSSRAAERVLAPQEAREQSAFLQMVLQPKRSRKEGRSKGCDWELCGARRTEVTI